MIKSPVLVTGATGFVGKRLIAKLSLDGVNYQLISRTKVPNSMTYQCDLAADPIPIDALRGVNTVFHLAGYAHDLKEGIESEHLYHDLNVTGTVRLAEAALKSGVKRFVFVSSVKAGGLPELMACADEVQQEEPDGIYGKTKREAELKLLELDSSSMGVTIVRPSLVYGEGVKGNLHLMQAGIRKGWFPPLPETHNRRCMVHVDDLVNAILLLATSEKSCGEIYIATDGKRYSTRDIYKILCDLSGKKIPAWSVPKFVFDIAALLSPPIKHRINKLFGDECYCSEKLQSIGFVPKFTLREMNETNF